MDLTITVDATHARASLLDRHSLIAGDVYNPVYVDFSSLKPEQLSSVDDGSLMMTVSVDGAVVASASGFSQVQRQSSSGTPVTLPKSRKSVLSLCTDAMASVEGEPGSVTKARLEIADRNATYASCNVPLILRAFVPGSASDVPYTASQVDSMLSGKQDALTFGAPLSESDGTVSVAGADGDSAGVVRAGYGLKAEDGVLSVDLEPPVVEETVSDSPNPPSSAAVKSAVEGLEAEIAALSAKADEADGRISRAAVRDELSGVAFSGSYLDLSDRPDDGESAVRRWYSGTEISGKSSNPTAFPSSSADHLEGDMYLNESESCAYVCTRGGAPGDALWRLSCSLVGSRGPRGVSGQVKAVYSSVAAMQASFSSSDLAEGELAIVRTDDRSDPDNAKMYRKGLASFEFLCDLSGSDGSRIRVGTSISGNAESSAFPSSGIGSSNRGDLYVNSDDGSLYECVSSGDMYSARWTRVFSVKGRDGRDGAPGTDGTDGAPGTDGRDGRDGTRLSFGSDVSDSSVVVRTVEASKGDAYVNTDASSASFGSVYVCVGSDTATGVTSWERRGSLAGSDGADGRDGRDIGFGTAVSSEGTVTGLEASVDDLYVNSGTGVVYSCVSSDGQYTTWRRRGSLAGVIGPASSVDAAVPTWSGTTGTVLTSGMPVLDSLPVSSSAGAGRLITAKAVFDALANLQPSGGGSGSGSGSGGGGSILPASYNVGDVPAFGLGGKLSSGYSVTTSMSVESPDRPSETALVTESAVASLVGSVPEFSGGYKGFVPSSTEDDAGKFLRADGTWASAGGGGGGGSFYDMTYVPAGGMTPSATEGAVAETVSIGGRTRDVVRFAKNVKSSVEFAFDLPDDVDLENGGLMFKLDWACLDEDASDGQSARFHVGCVLVESADEFGEDISTDLSSSPSFNTNMFISYDGRSTVLHTVKDSFIIMGNKSARHLYVNVTRSGQLESDTFSSDFILLGAGIQYLRTANASPWVN